MACACFLPACLVCLPPSKPAQVAACACVLPRCSLCFPAHGATPLNMEVCPTTRAGSMLTTDMISVIGHVDAMIAEQFTTDTSQPKLLSHGPDWETLPTWKTGPGSRHDHLVAHLCGCTPWTVRTARYRRQAPQSDPGMVAGSSQACLAAPSLLKSEPERLANIFYPSGTGTVEATAPMDIYSASPEEQAIGNV